MLQPRSLGPGVTVFDDVDVERDDMLDEIIGLKGDDLGISQLIGADRVGMGVWIKLVSRRCLVSVTTMFPSGTASNTTDPSLFVVPVALQPDVEVDVTRNSAPSSDAPTCAFPPVAESFLAMMSVRSPPCRRGGPSPRNHRWRIRCAAC